MFRCLRDDYIAAVGNAPTELTHDRSLSGPPGRDRLAPERPSFDGAPMLFDTWWLEDVSAISRRVLLVSAWLAGFVLTLRRRPAAGARPAAAGFGLLAAVQAGALAFYLAFRRTTPYDPFWSISLEVGGVTIDVDPSHLYASAHAVACLAEAAGAALVVTGLLRSWRDRAEPARREPAPRLPDRL